MPLTTGRIPLSYFEEEEGEERYSNIFKKTDFEQCFRAF